MYAYRERFVSGGESALVSSMGNEIISLRLHIILLHYCCIESFAGFRSRYTEWDVCVYANVKLLLCHPWENKQ